MATGPSLFGPNEVKRFQAISRPAEVRAIAPDPMLDHRQPAGQCECDIGFCLPRRLAMFLGQALSRDHLIDRVNIVCAAS
jgi:hypothetical protein